MAKVKKYIQSVLPDEAVINKIYFIRGQKIMLDEDLAVLYQVETKRLNEQVKRNADRFPEDFLFRLTAKEWQTMRSQFVTAFSQNIHIQNSYIMMSKIATSCLKYEMY